MTTPTNEQIAKNKSFWDEYFNVEAHPENSFESTTYEERLEMINKAYPEDSEA